MEPQWYFTSPELRDYMSIAVRNRWDIGDVGAKIEAFAIAGCDVSSKSIGFGKNNINQLFQTYLAILRRRQIT
jgi:hypothetical protein